MSGNDHGQGADWGNLKLSVGAEQVTRELEQGHTRLLETVLKEVQSQADREKIFGTVQHVNENHLKHEPAGQHLPKLEFEKSGAWPFAGGDDLVIYRTAHGKKEPLYAEDDYKGDDGKNHVRHFEHRP
jgi:hypothetical protein